MRRPAALRASLLSLLSLVACQEPSDEYKNLLDRVVLLEERLRLTNIPELTDDETNERSLLEIFTDTVGDFVMNRLLPRSDAQCRWNYAKSVCVPRCDCSFQHRAGDLTLSRACRLKAPDAAREACDPDVSGELGTLDKVGRALSDGLGSLWSHGNAFLHDAAPPSDEACDWSWRTRACEPRAACSLQYAFGDYHLGRACRSRVRSEDGAETSFEGADAYREAAEDVAYRPDDDPDPPRDDAEGGEPGGGASPFGVADDDRDTMTADRRDDAY